MKSPSGIPIPFHSLKSSSVTSSESIGSPSSTLGGDTTTYTSKKAINGKRLQDQQRLIRAYSHVLWSHQFPSHLPDNDERHLPKRNRYRRCHHLHGRYPYCYHRKSQISP